VNEKEEELVVEIKKKVRSVDKYLMRDWRIKQAVINKQQSTNYSLKI
jgi:hypothetical protein